jgi:hypothetical protein
MLPYAHTILHLLMTSLLRLSPRCRLLRFLQKCDPKDTFALTSTWRWTMPAWSCSIGSGADLEGWSYAIEPSLAYHPKRQIEDFIRKRTWSREKQAVSTVKIGGVRKSYTTFFERLEYFKRDLKSEEKDDDLVSLTSLAHLSATW